MSDLFLEPSLRMEYYHRYYIPPLEQLPTVKGVGVEGFNAWLLRCCESRLGDWISATL